MSTFVMLSLDPIRSRQSGPWSAGASKVGFDERNDIARERSLVGSGVSGHEFGIDAQIAERCSAARIPQGGVSAG